MGGAAKDTSSTRSLTACYPHLRNLMSDFLKRLFGGGAKERHAEPLIIEAVSEDCDGNDGADVTTRYFALSEKIERSKADGDYRRAISAARETFVILPDFVQQWVREHGAFDIATSHAVHTGSTLMAVMGDRDGIRELRAVLQLIPELREFLPEVEEAEINATSVDEILAAVSASPGLVQAELKRHVNAADGRRLSTLVAWLDKGGRLRRIKTRSGYRLYPLGHAITAIPEPMPAGVSTSGPLSQFAATNMVVLPTRRDRPAERAVPLDLIALPYVRLPKAPPHWEERQREDAEVAAERVANPPKPRNDRRTEKARNRGTLPLFVVDGDNWELTNEEKLAPEDRPDPSYKDVYRTSGSTYWLDAKGHREGFENAASVLRVTDRAGEVVAERGLAHDVYRSDVNTDGSAILLMSRDGVLHGYSDHLKQIVVERVEDLPEYRAQAKRLGIEPRELRTHVRCVAISPDGSRYLVTVVDEAWCVTMAASEVLWGLRFPAQEGWARVITPRSERFGTSAEIADALAFMDLSLPSTPGDITRQYRKLAMQWHPDRNAGDARATSRFQDLGQAMELLSGADLAGIGRGDLGEITYEKIMSRTTLDAGGGHRVELSIGMVMSEKSAADWIYAANFAASDNRVFLAGYSGKIVEVSERGIAVRVYDIGAVPRHIAETDSHLYLLTDTRLYVLSGDRLDALVDVFGQGDLIVGDLGFGLLESKAFSWFTPSGKRIGGVRTRDPLRRVLSLPTGLVVETRQHRAVVTGPHSWWKS
jgi:hypothetical protein